MEDQFYQYVIVGGGLAGAAAIEGIRERDSAGRILLVCGEPHLPYDRPPLSKQLWTGKKTVADITLHDWAFYAGQWAEVALGTTVVSIDPAARTVTDATGAACRYDRLLLATGGAPRRLEIPGGDLAGVCYYRYLDDYVRIRAAAAAGKSAVIIGGGFIGSEMAAALRSNDVQVTMIYPEPYLVARVFPESLGRALQEMYAGRGIAMVSNDVALSIERRGDQYVVNTRGAQSIAADIVIAGVGITPTLDLARAAGLTVDNGIAVNVLLQTSHPDIYAAGDNALFPYQALGQSMRIEHWDHAINQGKWAGRNMAGAEEPFTYMPFFFSDLFEFGYEAVGEVDARLTGFADWQKENDTGVIYYLRDGKVRGAMMCNVWDRVEAARELIRGGRAMAPEDLRGAIK